MINALRQRWFYLKNYNKGLSLIFLLPGFARERFGENIFFKSVTRNCKEIILDKNQAGEIFLHSGKFDFKFPKNCFYEGDFFDITYPSLKLKDETIDTFIYDNPFYDSEGCYEDFGTLIQKGDYVVDAGANVGMFSVVASHKVGHGGKVFAFEPLPAVISFLRENIKKNNCTNIIIDTAILGDSNKDVDFFYNTEDNLNAASIKFKKEGDSVTTMKQITLDSYVKNHTIEKIDFIKADIEGSERELLRGAMLTIKKFKPKIAIRTYHLPDDPKVLYDIIKEYVPEYKIKLHKKTLYAWI